MSYTPTVWETGDIITAEKLNNMEQGIEDAFVAPEVTATDQGKVLTVDSSGEWDAANLKDIYILKGTVVVDQDLAFVSFTLDEGDPSKIDDYKMSYLEVSLKMGTTTIMKANVPYDRHSLFNTTTLQPLDIKIFTAMIPTIHSPGNYQIFTYTVIGYNVQSSTWTCTLERIKLDFMT